MINLAIVDDKLVNRKTVSSHFLYSDEVTITLQAANGGEFLEKMQSLSASVLPNVVLMDIEMPILNGIETIAIGSIKYPNIKFLVLTVFDDDEKIFEAIQAGAHGYLLKDESAEQLINAVKNVIDYNGVPMSPAIARKTLQWMKAAPKPAAASQYQTSELLSEREIEILKLMVEGADYKKIADLLFISPHTVRTHISKIYDKLHVNSKAQAIQMAHKMKWV